MENGKEQKDDKQDFQKFTLEGDTYKTLLTKKFISRKNYEERDWGVIKSFIPGTIITVYVKEKQKIKAGEKLLVLDAMKMQNQITSPIKGVVKKIHIKAGERVANHQLLVEIR